MVAVKACSICGGPALPGLKRCAAHAKPPRKRAYYAAARTVRANATHCALCGGPFNDPNDPPVADHIIPRGSGGSDDIGNLQVAHRSCNGRKGAAIWNGAW